MERDGFAIALAWPETYCKQSGSWYDDWAHYFNLSNNRYYKVGHAAIVLVDSKGECFYYDFGRYHAPFGFGRVRSSESDPELFLKTFAQIKNQKIDNFLEILDEIAHKKECHGEGKLIASCTRIQFSSAKSKADQMLQSSPWKYGPFILSGTNCSRFVRSIIVAGKPNFKVSLKMFTQITITASPKINVRNLGEIWETQTPFLSKKPSQKPNTKSVLSEPIVKPNIHAKWYSGEGAGSWFCIEAKKNHYEVRKYSELGTLESSYKMTLNQHQLDPEKDYIISFPCHAYEMKITQNTTEMILKRQ